MLDEDEEDESESSAEPHFSLLCPRCPAATGDEGPSDSGSFDSLDDLKSHLKSVHAVEPEDLANVLLGVQKSTSNGKDRRVVSDLMTHYQSTKLYVIRIFIFRRARFARSLSQTSTGSSGT